MNKTELCKNIAQRCGISREIADGIVSAFLTELTLGLGEVDKVSIAKLGTFVVKKKAARQYGNPHNDEVKTVEERETLRFSAGRHFQARMTVTEKPATSKSTPNSEE